MATEREYNELREQLEELRKQLISRSAAALAERPEIGRELLRQVNQMLAALETAAEAAPPPADGGLAQLIGLGAEAAADFGEARHARVVETYDDTVTKDRIRTVGDLYYIYQHERLGVFRAVFKLNELYRAGAVQLDAGQGAYALYRYDRKQVLRYTRRDRLQAYRRVFGYTNTPPATGAKPNADFHRLLVGFITQVAQFYRDRRISNVIRQRPQDPSYGSIAIVRRAGLDLRNNLKNASYGHVTPMRTEVLQLLEEAFRILNSPDVRNLFGADNAWEVLEHVMRRYFKQPQIQASQRNRLASAGRDVLHWVGDDYILNADRNQFEAHLEDIADLAEEWLMSAQALRLVAVPVASPRRSVPVIPARAREFAWNI